MVAASGFWLPSLIEVVSSGAHFSVAEGDEVRLGRFWWL